MKLIVFLEQGFETVTVASQKLKCSCQSHDGSTCKYITHIEHALQSEDLSDDLLEVKHALERLPHRRNIMEQVTYSLAQREICDDA